MNHFKTPTILNSKLSDDPAGPVSLDLKNIRVLRILAEGADGATADAICQVTRPMERGTCIWFIKENEHNMCVEIHVYLQVI